MDQLKSQPMRYWKNGLKLLATKFKQMKDNSYSGYSIYFHDKMPKAKFITIRNFVDFYLERQVELYDLFNSVNSFINYKNKKQDNVFEIEEKIMGLKTLLTMAEVKDTVHIEIFEEIALTHFNSPGSSKERAIAIHEAWRKKALELRDKEDINP